MKPMLTFTRPVMSEPWAPDVVHLVIAEGKRCHQACPHLTVIGNCDAFGITLSRGPNGEKLRCATCFVSAHDSIISNEKAEKAYARLIAIRGRKEAMTKTAEKQADKPRKSPADTRVQKDTRHLKIALTREEIEERAERAAYIWAEMQKQEAEAKAVASTFKARISELEGKLNALQQQVRDRCAYGDVDCDIVFEFKKKEVYTIRLDTKEEIERRDMRRDEMQEKFEFKEPEDALTKATEQVQAELDEQGDRTASELQARAKKSKKKG